VKIICKKNTRNINFYFLYADSKVLHPDDGASITFSLPPSQMSSRMQSTCTSRQPTAPPTPRGLSRRNSCSTFSMSSGLASMLNERGIQAITPSCLNTPTTQNFSPTITPCNSPEGGTPSNHHHNHNEPVSITSFLTSSAGLLKKKITGSSHHEYSASEKAAIILEKKAKLRSIKLLKNAETLGIENILPTTTTKSHRIVNKPLALNSSNIYTRYDSPMTQLTSLKYLSKNSQEHEVVEASSDKSEASVSVVTNSSQQQKSNLKESPEARAKQRLNRQKTRRSMNAQRPDLGTVSSVDKTKQQDTKQQGLIGTISSIFFGRKGGFL
jgi:hypothetical protein